MRFLNRIKNIIIPSEDEAVTSVLKKDSLTRQELLNSLHEQFLSELKNETTTESLLFHTSFTVYLRQKDYDRLEPSFPLTVKDSVNVFIKELKKLTPKYPDYTPHSRWWQFHLIAMPEGTIIDGFSKEELSDKLILIKSAIFADNDYNDNTGDDRIVTTVHTVNSMKSLPKAMNLSAIAGLTPLDKDKYRVEMNLNVKITSTPANDISRNKVQNNALATLTVEDSSFLDGARTSNRYFMTTNNLQISGRHDVETRGGMPIARLDNDTVINPHLIIKRDPVSGSFFIKVNGETRLNEQKLSKGNDKWNPLPNNSAILINDDIQINFTIN